MIEEVEQEVVETESNNDITAPGPTFDDPATPAPKGKKKKSKLRSTIEWIFTGLFVALFVVFGVGQIDGMIHKEQHQGQMLRFGWSTYVVWTDSMEPVYPVNSAIITYLDSEEAIVSAYHNGLTVDITFMNTQSSSPDISYYEAAQYITTEPYASRGTMVFANAIMTHRLVEIVNYNGVNYFVTAGINDKGEYSRASQFQISTYDKVVGTVKIGSPFLGAVFNFMSSPFGLLVFLLIPALYLAITSVIDILKALKDTDDEGETTGSSDKPKLSSLNNLSTKDRERLKKEMLEEMLKSKSKKKDEGNNDA